MTSMADLWQRGSDQMAITLTAGDVASFHTAIEQTSVPLLVGVWRPLKLWADANADAVPDTFAMAAMLDAALANDPLPSDPTDLRAAIEALDCRDLNAWWRLLFSTGVYRRRTTSFLAARLVEHHLGATWATSPLAFDVTQWRIPKHVPAEALDDGAPAPRSVPCWITRTPDVSERRWKTEVFTNGGIGHLHYAYTATNPEFSILFVNHAIVFGESGILLHGNKILSGHGIKLLDHDYNATSIPDIVQLIS